MEARAIIFWLAIAAILLVVGAVVWALHELDREDRQRAEDRKTEMLIRRHGVVR